MNLTISLIETGEACIRMMGEIEFVEVQCLLKRFMIWVRRHVHHCHVIFDNDEVHNQFSSDVASW
jgi:hypothetical protein